MAANILRTVWFPKDFPILLGLNIPLWGIGGLVWGIFMTLLTDGQLGKWLIIGMFWAAACWFLFAILLIIIYREIEARIPAGNLAELPQRLATGLKHFRYTIEQQSPTNFVCKPTKALTRIIPLECTKLHVEVEDGSIDLSGPAFVVKRVRKELLKT